jgi:hypothetical protein
MGVCRIYKESKKNSKKEQEAERARARHDKERKSERIAGNVDTSRKWPEVGSYVLAV